MGIKIYSLERNPWLCLDSWQSLETFAKIISVTSIWGKRSFTQKSCDIDSSKAGKDVSFTLGSTNHLDKGGTIGTVNPILLLRITDKLVNGEWKEDLSCIQDGPQLRNKITSQEKQDGQIFYTFKNRGSSPGRTMFEPTQFCFLFWLGSRRLLWIHIGFTADLGPNLAF